jgi:hypothetical protein
MSENRPFFSNFPCWSDGFGLVLIHFAVGGWGRGGSGFGAG